MNKKLIITLSCMLAGSATGEIQSMAAMRAAAARYAKTFQNQWKRVPKVIRVPVGTYPITTALVGLSAYEGYKGYNEVAALTYPVSDIQKQPLQVTFAPETYRIEEGYRQQIEDILRKDGVKGNVEIAVAPAGSSDAREVPQILLDGRPEKTVLSFNQNAFLIMTQNLRMQEINQDKSKRAQPIDFSEFTSDHVINLFHEKAERINNQCTRQEAEIKTIETVPLAWLPAVWAFTLSVASKRSTTLPRIFARAWGYGFLLGLPTPTRSMLGANHVSYKQDQQIYIDSLEKMDRQELAINSRCLELSYAMRVKSLSLEDPSTLPLFFAAQRDQRRLEANKLEQELQIDKEIKELEALLELANQQVESDVSEMSKKSADQEDEYATSLSDDDSKS